MAKKTTTKSITENTLPEGYTSAKPDKADYYYRPTPGSVIEGLLLSRHEKKAGRFPGHYYHIRLSREVVATAKDEEGDYHDTTATIGSVLSVDEKGALQGLSSVADGKHMVYLACGNKKSIGNEQTAWDFVVGYRDATKADLPF